ncbi:hypothetical protein [Altericista sp. CCNU0014]|uniref:hypothetical protein n=1 Tax=Altericista sp. CCNU0014 TaxID=3082949 RepID=UPI00384FF718
MDIARYLASYKKLNVGSPEYNDFMNKLEKLGIVGIPLPTQKMPRFTPKYYTAQFVEERQEELGEDVLKAYLAIAIQTLILKRKVETPQFEAIEGSIVDEYLRTLESEFEPIDDKTLNKLYVELTRKPRKQTEDTEDKEESLDTPPSPTKGK